LLHQRFILVFMEHKTGFTLEAVTDQDGKVLLPGHVKLPARQRLLITVLDSVALQDASPQKAVLQNTVDEITRLSELALEDWNRPEEDAAWSHLQQEG
jgi:hypothetical protein